jgi:hypothetical protein
MNDRKGNFAPTETVSVGDRPLKIVAGDMDGDGDLDLAVVNNTSSSISILTGNDSGYFSYHATVNIPNTVGTTVTAVAGDFDRDGYDDLLVTDGDGSAISILINDGHGHFSETSGQDLGQAVIGAVAGDWDHDGDLDLAVTHDPTNKISILRNKTILAGVRGRIVELPSEYSLLQNYPNPFNPATTIVYELPHRTFVSLKVYNILGEQVSSLIENQEAAGRHEVRFAAG